MRRLLAPLVALAVLTAVWHLADGRAALGRLAAADAGWLAGAFLCLQAQTVLSALRWRLTAAGIGQAIPADRAVREYFVAQLLNQLVPGGMAGDGVRAIRARGPGGLAPSAWAVAVERLAGQGALLLVLAAGTAASLALPGVAWPSALWPAAVLAGALAALGLGAAAAAGGHAAGRVLRAGLLAPRLRWRQAGLAAAIVALNLAAFACAARATGIVLPPVAVAALGPLVLTAMLVPATVAGWGWREGAAAALFPLAGAPASAGLAAGVAYGGVMLLAALPGVFWLLGRPNMTVG